MHHFRIMAFALLVTGAQAATETPLSQNAVAVAVGHGNCTDAVTQAKRDVEANQPQSAFIAGRMLSLWIST